MPNTTREPPSPLYLLPFSCSDFTEAKPHLSPAIKNATSPSMDIAVKEESKVATLSKKDITDYKRLFWLCNIGVEIGIIAFHAIVIGAVPEQYTFYHRKFWFAIAVAILQIVITIEMKSKLQRIQIAFSFLHFVWIFYCLATVPTFLTAITWPLEECDPIIHSCAKVFNANTFQTKMTIGILSQLVFGLLCYGEIKRLSIIYYYPYIESTVEPSAEAPGKIAMFKVPADTPEKDPKQIVIVA